MKKHLNKELVITKEENEDFRNSTKCWIGDNNYVHNYVKVRDHCHTTRKYGDSSNKYFNINLKLKYFKKLKSYFTT